MSVEVALNLREEVFSSQRTPNGTLYADGCCLAYLPNFQGRQAYCPHMPLGVLRVSHYSCTN
jgi:hypothetical protein